MPMRFGRALVLAGIGGVATFLCWSALWTLFWGPYWHLLNRNGMYVHDIEATYLIVFGPFAVVAVFFASISAEAWFERRAFESGQPLPSDKLRILFLGACPATITFALINAPHADAWRFPLSETAVGLVGMAIGYLWVRWRRTDEPNLHTSTVKLPAAAQQ